MKRNYEPKFAQNPLSNLFMCMESLDKNGILASLKQLQSSEYPPKALDKIHSAPFWKSVGVPEPIASVLPESRDFVSQESSNEGSLNVEASGTSKLNPGSTRTDYNRRALINEIIDSALTCLKAGQREIAFQKIIEAKSYQESVPYLDHVRALCFLAAGDKRSALMSLQEELLLFPDNHDARVLHEELGSELKEAEGLRGLDPEFSEIYEKIKQYTMLPIPRLYSLYLLARKVCELDIQGNFVECGVSGGGSSALLCTVIKRHSKRPRLLYACDSYEGMPEPTDVDKALGVTVQDTKWGTGICADPVERVKNVCAITESAEFLVPIKGYFEVTLRGKNTEIGSIGFMHLDCDFYESTKVVLNELFDNISVGGLIQLDNYGHWGGIERAVSEFESNRGYVFQIHSIDGHSAWLQKTSE